MNYTYANKMLALVFPDGKTFMKPDVHPSKLEFLEQERSYEQVVEHFSTSEIFEQKREALSLFEQVRQDSLFTVRGNLISIDSISQVALPEDLIREILKADQQYKEALLNFWFWVCQNPDVRSRTNLFWFIKRWGLRISRKGFLVGYRNVLEKNSTTDLDKFVKEEYEQIKKNKKSPKNYVIAFEDRQYLRAKIGSQKEKLFSNPLGTLDTLYKNISVEQTFTDAHTESTTIRFGQVVSIPRSECDPDPDRSCSRGLHAGGKGWLEKAGSYYYGKKSIMVLINPADIVAIPVVDDYGKLRTRAYYPICEVKWEGGKIVDTLDEIIEDTFIQIIQRAYNPSEEQSVEYSIEIPNTPEIDPNRIETQLENMRKDKLDRVIVDKEYFDDEYDEDEYDDWDEEWDDEDEEYFY